MLEVKKSHKLMSVLLLLMALYTFSHCLYIEKLNRENGNFLPRNFEDAPGNRSWRESAGTNELTWRALYLDREEIGGDFRTIKLTEKQQTQMTRDISEARQGNHELAGEAELDRRKVLSSRGNPPLFEALASLEEDGRGQRRLKLPEKTTGFFFVRPACSIWAALSGIRP